MNRSEAARVREEKRRQERRAAAYAAREARRASRAEHNEQVSGDSARPSRARNRGHLVRSTTGARPEFRPAFIYPAGSVQGGHPPPGPIAILDGYGRRQSLPWRWNDPCPKCSYPVEYGYCTRCTWVCDNSARPEPEP